MVRPVLVKLGGSVLTDKRKKPTFRRAVTKRLLGELRRADVPAVVLHGAGSFGHPAASRHGIGVRPVTVDGRDGVSETLALAGRLHAEVVGAARDAGLRPISVPLHLEAHSQGGELLGIPVGRIQRLLDEGFVPVLPGTLVRDDELGWRVVSADETMEILAHELDPRLAVFTTDVEGVFDRDPQDPDARRLDVLRPADMDRIDATGGQGDDVTGRMDGKLQRAVAVAHECPTWIVDGTARGRLGDVLRGKDVPGTRVEA